MGRKANDREQKKAAVSRTITDNARYLETSQEERSTGGFASHIPATGRNSHFGNKERPDFFTTWRTEAT
jgi:hypothetical protein